MVIMKKMSMKTLSAIGLAMLLGACSSHRNDFDASGAFEAEETIISAEVPGTLKQFTIGEGQELKAGQVVGTIDSIQLYLRKKQLQAQIGALLSKRPDIATQLAALQEQLKPALRDQQRISNLVNANAATRKQLDDVNAQVEVIRKQIEAQRSSLSISSHGISEETVPLQLQIEQLEDQLAKCRIINPVNGTVLAKFMEANEMAAPGKPLYKIADISTLLLRAYITGGQLSQVKLGQKVKVMIDNGPDSTQAYEGTITWINDKSEFTPKTIQTRDERANIVYALKVQVKNDGLLKIGMYGEVKFKDR